MSPITAVLKCPHDEGRDISNEREGEEEVRQLLDGSRRVYYKNKLIATHPSTTFNEPIRALNRKRTHTKGTQSYSWVYMASQPFAIKRGHFCSALKGTY